MPGAPLEDLNLLRTFVTVAETRSFTAAAERLGLARPKVSVQVHRLEAGLGERLFNRTTRRVALTDVGQRLFDECAPLLHGMLDAVGGMGSDRTRLRGTLRISSSVDTAVQVLGPVLAEFADEHPELQIDLRTSDRVVDLVADGIDVAIRMGWLRDSTLRATKLGEFDQVVVASPAYLKRHGMPTHPAALAEHRWIALGLLPTPLTWTFTRGAEPPVTVRMKSRIRVDSPSALRAMLANGSGLSVSSQPHIVGDLASGALVRVLQDWSLPRGGIYTVYPPGRYVPAATRAFVERVRVRLQAREAAAGPAPARRRR